MRQFIVKIVQFLGRRSRRSIVIIGAVLALCVGIPYYFVGPGIGFSIFYLLPIALTTWYAGRWAGIVISGVSAAIWVAADAVSAIPSSKPSMWLWNFTVRMSLFVINVLLLDAFKREKSSAREDYLTGLGNRRHFFELAEGEIKRSERYGHPFTLAYIDVDEFKSINDRFGHAAGDALLKSISQSIKSNARATDITARLGGDEFAVLLPESGQEAAEPFFNKLYQILSDVARQNSWPVTFSIGVVTFEVPPDSIDEMIRIVDDVMYVVKGSGKNLVRYETFP
jgi:diguanylate cyclase (GGDEF)-like protein